MALIFCLPCMYRPCTTCVFLLELYAGSIRRCALAILLEIARRCTFTILLEAHARGRAPGCKTSISHVGSCPGPLGVCSPSCLGFMLKVVLRCLLAVLSRMHGRGACGRRLTDLSRMQRTAVARNVVLMAQTRPRLSPRGLGVLPPLVPIVLSNFQPDLNLRPSSQHTCRFKKSSDFSFGNYWEKSWSVISYITLFLHEVAVVCYKMV